MAGTERQQFLEAFGGLYAYKKRAAALGGNHRVGFDILNSGLKSAGVQFTKDGLPILSSYTGDGTFLTEWTTVGGVRRSRVERVPWMVDELDHEGLWPDWHKFLLNKSHPFKEACGDLYPDRLQLEVWLVAEAGGNGRANPQVLDRELSLRREIIWVPE